MVAPVSAAPPAQGVFEGASWYINDPLAIRPCRIHAL